MRRLAWLLLALAAPVRADVTVPVTPEKVDAAPPKAPIDAQMEALYGLVNAFRDRDTGFGPVAVYDIWERPNLPSRIYIANSTSFKGIVEGLLDATLEPGWKSSGKYWILEKEEAVRRLSKSLKMKDKAQVDALRKALERELGPSLFMVYRVHKGSKAVAPLPPEETEVPVVPPSAAPPPAKTPAPPPPKAKAP